VPALRKKHICDCFIRIFFLLSLLLEQKISSSQNLIVNGSMNSAEGENVVAPGWIRYSTSPSNTPDVNDSAGPLNSTVYYVWSGGMPVASPDGGTWQNVFGPEDFMQTISGLTIGTTYNFRYYYASQGITAGSPAPNYIYPFPPSVTITGATGYSNPPAGTLFQWNTYSGALVATSTSITIIASQGNNDAYMAFDGFYLGTTPPPDALIISQALPDTVCNAGNAVFTVEAQNTSSYHWQVNAGSGWTNIADNTQYSGALTNSLSIKNATTEMSNYQYRCYVSGTCCDAYSIPATLNVLPPSAPFISVKATSTDICAGDRVTFSATTTNEGSSPVFQWTKNGAKTGTDSALYSDSTLKNGDVINCILISNNICVVNNRASSNNITIAVKPCIPGFHIPSAFTPNNDGKNDLFRPLLVGNIVQYNFTVYNRWGQVVFQTGQPGKGWDGTVSGVRQNSGVFAWICSYQLQGEKLKTEKGTVMLVR
jgi:gliding motility-associated-like protein